MTTNGQDPFDGLRPTRAPESLRERVLDAARQATVDAPTATLWDRLFESRPLRAAWGVLCLVLVAGHVALTDDTQPLDPGSRSLVDAPELREVLELPPLEAGDFGPDWFATDSAPAPIEHEGASSDEGVPS